MAHPSSKLAMVQTAMQSGDWEKAICIAAKFPELGDHKKPISRAYSAYTNPRSAVQLFGDLDAVKEAGRIAMIERFSSM